eukprot:CAMPEP_0177663426 /NCGR_PEP_ID=MMETSP0447-20121125/19904_1 /TAXON_ID=0 /ORGANISM="Stygamoeba regulata, Strain BSH-02190019" /LENGTH=115 /DNA_ID=CAMNT_0019169231 /DNA_START=67 /DNA_END=414 /DNA_ORIENTATION=-
MRSLVLVLLFAAFAAVSCADVPKGAALGSTVGSTSQCDQEEANCQMYCASNNYQSFVFDCYPPRGDKSLCECGDLMSTATRTSSTKADGSSDAATSHHLPVVVLTLTLSGLIALL